MAKYIDADCLRSEIKKSINEIVIDALDHDTGIEKIVSAKYRKDALCDVLSIIDSLQQEQPEVDLEKEIDAYLEPIKPSQIQEAPFTSMENIARYFYELGLNARKEE